MNLIDASRFSWHGVVEIHPQRVGFFLLVCGVRVGEWCYDPFLA